MCPTHPHAANDVLQLLVSEAVTNAVIHGRPPIRLTLECCADAVEVRIFDASPRSPEERRLDRSAIGGRGVNLIAQLASTWGVQSSAEGKEVWFRVVTRLDDLEGPI